MKLPFQLFRVIHYYFVPFFFVQEALSNLEDYDKTCLESALQGVSNVVQQEWGSACPCQVCSLLCVKSHLVKCNHTISLCFRFLFLSLVYSLIVHVLLKQLDGILKTQT